MQTVTPKVNNPTRYSHKKARLWKGDHGRSSIELIKGGKWPLFHYPASRNVAEGSCRKRAKMAEQRHCYSRVKTTRENGILWGHFPKTKNKAVHQKKEPTKVYELLSFLFHEAMMEIKLCEIEF